MFSTGNKLLSALCASVFALSAMAADVTTVTTVVSEKFETDGDVTKAPYSGWTGHGTVSATDATYTGAAGLPISAGQALGKALSVQGTVQCAASTGANKPATVDMMIQIAKPDDALELPPTETTETTEGGIQIAVGVDTDLSLKVYCKDKSDKSGWCQVASGLAEGSWHRMSFTFDYGKGTCQISLDGVALVSANGYLTSDPSERSTSDGSWYKLNASASQLATVKVIGSTAIDEVVVKYGATNAEVLPAPEGKTNGVPNAWLLAQGVADPTQEAPDGSGMTVVEKYQAGFGVTDTKKLAITKMEVTDAGMKLTVPAAKSPTGYRNVIEVTPGVSAEKDTVVIGSETTVVVPMPAVNGGKAVKKTYQIKTQTTTK